MAHEGLLHVERGLGEPIRAEPAGSFVGGSAEVVTAGVQGAAAHALPVLRAHRVSKLLQVSLLNDLSHLLELPVREATPHHQAVELSWRGEVVLHSENAKLACVPDILGSLAEHVDYCFDEAHALFESCDTVPELRNQLAVGKADFVFVGVALVRDGLETHEHLTFTDGVDHHFQSFVPLFRDEVVCVRGLPQEGGEHYVHHGIEVPLRQLRVENLKRHAGVLGHLRPQVISVLDDQLYELLGAAACLDDILMEGRQPLCHV